MFHVAPSARVPDTKESLSADWIFSSDMAQSGRSRIDHRFTMTRLHCDEPVSAALRLQPSSGVITQATDHSAQTAITWPPLPARSLSGLCLDGF